MPIGSRCRADEKKSHHFLSFWPPAVLALNGAERRNKKIARDCRLNFRSRRFHFRSLYIGTARRPGPFDRCSLLSHRGSSHHIFLLIASIDRCSAPCRVHVIFRCSRSNRSTEPVSNKFHDQIVRTSKLCARRVCLRHEFALHRGTGERERVTVYIYITYKETHNRVRPSLSIYIYILLSSNSLLRGTWRMAAVLCILNVRRRRCLYFYVAPVSAALRGSRPRAPHKRIPNDVSYTLWETGRMLCTCEIRLFLVCCPIGIFDEELFSHVESSL